MSQLQLDIKKIDIPELDEPVYVLPLSAGALQKLMSGQDDIYPILFASSICDDTGRLIFAGDVESVSSLPAGMIHRTCSQILEINGLSNRDNVADMIAEAQEAMNDWFFEFSFYLADRAGRPEQRQAILDSMSYQELVNWYAYYAKYSFAPKGTWEQAAMVAHTVYTTAPNFSKSRRKKRKLEHFMPKQKRARKPEMSALDMLKVLEGSMKQFGGQDLRSEAKKQATYEELTELAEA